MSFTPKETKALSIDDVYAQMDKDGKKLKPVPMSTFLPAAFVGVPVYLFGILPLTVTYQLAKAIVQPLLPSTSKEEEEDSVPISSNVELPSNVIPRKDRKYDVVVLGATGFTGKLAAIHLAKTYGVSGDGVKWAIAGRSQSKLDKVKQFIAEETSLDNVHDLDTMIVDTNVLETLPTLVKDTKCVITTAGPFAKYGSNVVEYCTKYGTHYVDTTGEIEWVKAMILKWDDVAKQTGAIICPLCGHDSVPWDLTVFKLTQLMREQASEELTSVTFLDEVKGEASGGTMETILMSLDGKAAKAPASDFDPLMKTPQGTKSQSKTKNISPVLKLEPCGDDAPRRYASSWTMPFLMQMVNGSTVKRSNAIAEGGVPSLQYKEVAVVPDFKTAFVNMFGLVAGLTALMNPVTRSLVKNALPKPGEGPSKRAMDRHYLCITGQGVGSKGSRAEAVMYFSTDAGYRDTARMVAESGLCLALDEAKLKRGGGFWTPATAMGDVLLDRLVETGTLFASRMMPQSKL